MPVSSAPRPCSAGVARGDGGSSLGELSLPAWLSIAYLGFFGTCLGFVWYYGDQAIGPSKSSVFINFVPISAVIMSFFLLGETIDASLLIGAALVLSGILPDEQTFGNHVESGAVIIFLDKGREKGLIHYLDRLAGANTMTKTMKIYFTKNNGPQWTRSSRN